MRGAAGLGLLLAPLAIGCVNAPIYFNSPTPILAVTGMPDANNQPPRVENGMSLRFRNPTKQEQQGLDAQTAALGFMVPWIQRANVHIELTFDVTNTDTKDGTFFIGIDGANEYTKYDENIVAMALQAGNNNAPTYIPLCPVTPQIVPAGKTVSGTVREDDFNEGELDLD
ncbi:MAG TPA: hypothetical protein VIJ59_07770, partial [Caulobacteraceae bacterium]